MLRPYHATGTCAPAFHDAVEPAGSTHPGVREDLAASGRAPAPYRAVNPEGRVPALPAVAKVLAEEAA